MCSLCPEPPQFPGEGRLIWGSPWLLDGEAQSSSCSMDPEPLSVKTSSRQSPKRVPRGVRGRCRRKCFKGRHRWGLAAGPGVPCALSLGVWRCLYYLSPTFAAPPRRSGGWGQTAGVAGAAEGASRGSGGLPAPPWPSLEGSGRGVQDPWDLACRASSMFVDSIWLNVPSPQRRVSLFRLCANPNQPSQAAQADCRAALTPGPAKGADGSGGGPGSVPLTLQLRLQQHPAARLCLLFPRASRPLGLLGSTPRPFSCSVST